MSAAPQVVVHRDPAVLTAAAAARLITALADAQAARGHAHVVLTGGGTGIATLAAVAASPARDAVDWSAVDLWWGDERFLPDGDGDRNATQAVEALLAHVPVDPQRVHPMPPSDGAFGDDPDAAATGYARELALAAGGSPDDAVVPPFDVLLLGMGPDGHVASLFPEHPAQQTQGRTTVGVHGSPKPPPRRVSLTFEAINAARQVWLVVAGADKAPAVAMALSGTGRLQIPAAGVAGVERTLWLIDEAAAAQLPTVREH